MQPETQDLIGPCPSCPALWPGFCVWAALGSHQSATSCNVHSMFEQCVSLTCPFQPLDENTSLCPTQGGWRRNNIKTHPDHPPKKPSSEPQHPLPMFSDANSERQYCQEWKSPSLLSAGHSLRPPFVADPDVPSHHVTSALLGA